MSGDFGRRNSKFLGHVLARSYQRWTQETRRCENPRCQTNSRFSDITTNMIRAPLVQNQVYFYSNLEDGWARQASGDIGTSFSIPMTYREYVISVMEWYWYWHW